MMTNWKEAICLNNHAVALLEGGGGAANDGAIVQSLQDAVVLLQHAIQQEKMCNDVFPMQGTQNEPCGIDTDAYNVTVTFASKRIRCFQEPDFFLFDHAFLLPEFEDASRTGFFSNGRDRNSWIELQSSVVLFNLGLTLHRRALLHRQYEQQISQDCDVVLLQETQVLFFKSKLLYTMSNNVLVEHGEKSDQNSNDLFPSTRFALRLGIANNMAHIAFFMEDPKQGDVAPIQQVAQLIGEASYKKAAMTLPFEILSGIMMNITSWNQSLSHWLAAAA
ncbi:hypothetical protein IV203_025330 [Nitzschia inconspicua]|uniref:Uncharacterized protein n=1 Tax=Nitzschia inconspicua TaxID=303405 RepID=A0A9K3PAE9_9STRA|nr:hypothetical protein IV203_024665 [Nitzschia inconspicua]KAG7362446.1 hypothetical protein IV203_025330 [Nitzschia inconspicua]